MQDSSIPPKFTIPFGNSATYINNPIPTTGQPNGLASFETGFPATNSLFGGIPPWGADETGIHYMETNALRWVMAGGRWPYDGTFSATVGGYPQGAIVPSANTLGLFWFNLSDNNTTNPESGPENWTNWPLNLYAVDSGTVNALAGAFPVSLAALPVGAILKVNAAYNNTTTAPTLAYNGGTPVTITLSTGASIPVGGIVANTPAYIMVGAGGAFWLQNPQVASGGGGGVGQANGQCRLVYSNTSTATLIPYDGNGLVINGVLQIVPSGGITVAASGSGLLYVYAAWSGSMSLLLSATAWAYNSAGIPVMSGDATKTLVGVTYVAGSAFGANLVLSWYNRRNLSLQGNYQFTATTNAGSLTDLGSGGHLTFLVWADEGVSITINAIIDPSDASMDWYAGMGIDGSVVNLPSGLPEGYLIYNALPGVLAEGFHTISCLAATGGAGAVQFYMMATITARG